MFISPGEIARGQWLMIHSSKKSEDADTWNDDPEVNPLANILMLGASASESMTIPHIVLSVQIPFVAVANCTMTPCISKVWRTDEKNFIEVKEEFVKALDINCWHRGQKLIDPSYQIPLPQVPKVKPHKPNDLGDWPFQSTP